MSEASASSTKSAGGRALGADDLVAKLHKRANVGPNTPFSLTEHLSAGRVLVALRDSLLAGGVLSKRSKLMVICTGIALRRRYAASEVAVEADGPSADAAVLQDQESSRSLLLESAHLIFSLLCLIERRERGDEAVNALEAVARVSAQCLWDVLKPRTRKRPREDSSLEKGCEEGEGSGENGDCDGTNVSWSDALRVSTAEVAGHALRIGAAELAKKHPGDSTLMSLYFRSAAASMAEAMLLKSQTDFVSLGLNTGDMSVSREKKLLAIAQAAESEMGQSILRDLVLSFLLPASVIGVRRGLLLSRAASTEAGIDHPIAVARAHDTAMAGAEFIWANGTDELERMCCLLAGVAILTTKGGDDPIRKLEAFGGRVSLPFLETTGVDATGLRMALLPNARRWVLYRLGGNGTPKVLSSLANFHGLCESVLALVVS
jgi:hypothetical protein